MDLVDLELSGRDGEVADLKQTTFSRERQQGVQKVEEEGGEFTMLFEMYLKQRYLYIYIHAYFIVPDIMTSPSTIYLIF